MPYQDSLLYLVEGPSPDTIRLQQLFQSLPLELQIAIGNEFLLNRPFIRKRYFQFCCSHIGMQNLFLMAHISRLTLTL